MGHVHRPRRGSMQYWPRKRARRNYARIRRWPKVDSIKLLGFAGYKAGMTHLIAIDNKQTSPTKGTQISIPITVIECPPIKPFSIRFYQDTPYGLKLISEIFTENLDKDLKRKIDTPKKIEKAELEKKLKEIETSIEKNQIHQITILTHTQPRKVPSVNKKKPEIFEIAVGGKDIKEKFNYAKNIMGQEIKVKDVFRDGQFVDIHAVTKGKGFQGPVKRFGVSLKAHKSEKKRRSAGNLGPWTPEKVSPTVPQHGQHGYHTRTEYNKLILAIKDNPEEINKKGGIVNYGTVRNSYILVKGSVLGPHKRIVRLIEPIRTKKAEPVEIKYIAK